MSPAGHALLAAALGLSCAGRRFPADGPLALERRSAGAREIGAGLWLHCEPLDAEVLVDGVLQGRCGELEEDKVPIRLADGLHVVEVRRTGHSTFRGEVEAGGARASLTVRLDPLR